MDVNELIMQFVDDRIQELISGCAEVCPNQTEPCMDVMELVMKKIPPELQPEIEQLISQLIERRSKEERLLYISGLRDGAHICRTLSL